jgi:hypothetical protein
MHPGQPNVVYIVDVNGDRLVIDTWHMPGTSAADLAKHRALKVMRVERDAIRSTRVGGTVSRGSGPS